MTRCGRPTATPSTAPATATATATTRSRGSTRCWPRSPPRPRRRSSAPPGSARGAVKSARGAGKLLGEALGTARACGAGGPDRSGLVLLRGDSAFYGHDVIAAARRGGARFSVTARMDAAVKKAIGEDAWTPIRYPQAVWDE